MKGVYTYIRDVTLDNSDAYYVKIGKKSVILISSFTGQKYDVDVDLDMGDINSFRKGYVFIQRLLLRIMHWPSVKTATMTFDENLKYFMKLFLTNVKTLLVDIIEKFKSRERACMEVYNAVPTQNEFNAGVRVT